MNKNDFWVISLVALTIIGLSLNWPLPVAIAVILNSIVVLIDVINQAIKIVKAKRV